MMTSPCIRFLALAARAGNTAILARNAVATKSHDQSINQNLFSEQ